VCYLNKLQNARCNDKDNQEGVIKFTTKSTDHTKDQLSVDEDCRLLGHGAVYSGRNISTLFGLF